MAQPAVTVPVVTLIGVTFDTSAGIPKTLPSVVRSAFWTMVQTGVPTMVFSTALRRYSPQSELVQGTDGTLYGTACSGDCNVAGTVFKMRPDGSGFTVLKWFTNTAEGANPSARLTLFDNLIYGTTRNGGVANNGTIFKLNTDGTGYTALKSFTSSDGANPSGGLTLLGNVLYGTTVGGGSSNHYGIVFKVNTDGTGYTVLKNFGGSDGAYPHAGVALSGSVLYGATFSGGISNYGTLFKLNTNGTDYTVLKHFTGGNDGWQPLSDLTLSGTTLYGTTLSGGISSWGTVFQINTKGTGYVVLKHCTYSDGGGSRAGLTLSGSTLYGTTECGGSLNVGTLFKLELPGQLTPIPLTAQSLGNAIILSWTNPAFSLQTAPEATGTYTNIPGATSPYTNSLSEPRRFFRLTGD